MALCPAKRVSILGTTLIVLCFMSAALGDANSLAQRLPRTGNALITLDVAKLLDSPLAKAESWQSKLMSGYADRPLAVPATARQVAMTAYLHPAGLESIWQAAIVDLPNAPRLEPMLQKQGGFFDDLAGKKAAWSTRDIYYIQLDGNSMGVLRPGDRQAAMRWTSTGSSQSLSPYLTSALSTSAGPPILFAVDLTNAVGASAVSFAFNQGKLPSLEKIEKDQSAIIAALGSVKGLRLKMNVGKDIDAEMTVDFDQSVDALGDSAKAVVIDALTAADLNDPAIESWNFKASGKTIVGTGKSDLEAVRRLVAVLSPGDFGPGGQQAAQTPPEKGSPITASESASPPPSPAAASQAYYRAVSKTLDQMSAKSSPTQSGAWLHAQARMIQQLPAVGVDPMLLEWGDSISGAFNKAAQTLVIGQQNAQVAAQGVQSPTGYSESQFGTQGGAVTDTPESRAAFRNAQQQRRQAAQQQRAAAGDQALSILNEAMASRGKVRTLMVQKYNVEF